MKRLITLFTLSFAFPLFSFNLFSTAAAAQTVRIEPERPRWGQKLTIIYDPSAPGAKFTPDDDLYVALRLSFPGFGEHASARMTKTGGQFRVEWPIATDLSTIAAQFVTLNGGWDEAAYTTAIIHRSDGKPARGALESKIKSQKYREFFDLEIALYPDNYSAYRAKWATAALIESNSGASAIRSDLSKLTREGNKNGESAELMCALSYGHLMIGREDRSREMISRSLSKFPDDPFTARAIGDYERLIAELGLPTYGLAEIARMKREIIRRRPQTELARAAAGAMAEDKNAPLDLIETICEQWMKAESENPRPWFDLALAYQNQYRKPERAMQLIEKAIELLRAGKLRLFGDVNGRLTGKLIYDSYVIKGEIASRLGRNDPALAALAVAKKLAPGNDVKAHLIEARILRAMNQPERAEAAFIEAWRRGSQEAEERLKAIYQEQRGGLQGFDDYLIGKSKNPNDANSDWKLPAPQFKISSLDGKTFDSKSLQGKIVVINMWFIGCGPCRREIPKLNEIVMEFKGRDVVFIAPTPDMEESLRGFLKTMSFDYDIVPEADRMLDQFNIATYPTHIVIDRDGQVEAMMVGAGERRPEEVRRLLLRLLGAQSEQR